MVLFAGVTSGTAGSSEAANEPEGLALGTSLKPASRNLLSVPPGPPFYEQQLAPQNSIAGGLKVLDGKNGVGTQVVLNNPPGTGAAYFTVQADGEIQLATQVNGKTYCLDVAGANYANIASVVTWPCNGQTNQKWNFVARGNNYYSISPVGNTSFCLDVKGGGTAINTPIIIFGCNGGSNQAWMLSAGG